MRKCFYCCDSDLTQTNHIVFPRGESNLKMHVLFWGAITILCCFIWRTCLRKGISETSHRIHHDSWCLSETRSVCVKLVLSKDLSALCLISFCVCETEHDCLPASLQGKKTVPTTPGKDSLVGRSSHLLVGTTAWFYIVVNQSGFFNGRFIMPISCLIKYNSLIMITNETQNC